MLKVPLGIAVNETGKAEVYSYLSVNGFTIVIDFPPMACG
jgi:hypothetical protein